MPRIRVSEPALQWLEQEAERIAARFGALAAGDFKSRIDEAMENLAAFPHLTRSGAIPGTRTMAVNRRTVLTIVERNGELVIAAARSHWQSDPHASAEEEDPDDPGPEGRRKA